MAAHLVGVRPAGERHLSRDRVVERAAEPIDVGHREHAARVTDRFGREVVGRANDLAGVGKRRGGAILFERPGEAEIGHLHLPGGGQQQVARLHVAVHETPLVRVADRVGRLEQHVRGDAFFDRPVSADQPPQVDPRNVLRDEVVSLPVAVGERHPHEVRVVERRLRADLSLEAADRLRGALVPGQDLDRLDAPEHLVGALEDVSHAAAGDRVDHAIGAELELGASLAELVDLPPVEQVGLDQLLGEPLVLRLPPVEAFGNERGLDAVQRDRLDQAAGDKRVAERSRFELRRAVGGRRHGMHLEARRKGLLVALRVCTRRARRQ